MIESMEDLSLDSLISIAELFRKVNKLDKCETILRKAVVLYPTAIKPPLCLGKLILQQHKTTQEDTLTIYQEQALELVQHAVSNNTTLSQADDILEAYNFLSALLLKMKKAEEALHWCKLVY